MNSVLGVILRFDNQGLYVVSGVILERRHGDLAAERRPTEKVRIHIAELSG